jgi:hypothetical protein
MEHEMKINKEKHANRRINQTYRTFFNIDNTIVYFTSMAHNNQLLRKLGTCITFEQINIVQQQCTGSGAVTQTILPYAKL